MPVYDFPNQKITDHFIPDMPLRVSALRTLGGFGNVFALESFMDEVADAAGADPVAFRLKHLKDERGRAVLQAAAEKAGWKPGAKSDGTRGRGVAFSRYETTKTYVAIVADVVVDRSSGVVRVERVTAAADAGPDDQSRRAEESDRRRHHPGHELDAEGTGRVRQGAHHVARLGGLSHPHLRRSARRGCGADRPPGIAAARRGRSLARPDFGGHRQRDPSCDGRAPARSSLHAGARQGGNRARRGKRFGGIRPPLPPGGPRGDWGKKFVGVVCAAGSSARPPPPPFLGKRVAPPPTPPPPPPPPPKGKDGQTAGAPGGGGNEEILRGEHPIPFTAQSRCWPGGTPAQSLYPFEPVYFAQTPKEVWMIWQRDHVVRRVFLTDRHSANVKPSWFGESIGHYENGDTLVVDTIGVAGGHNRFIDNFRTPHTDKMHVVERFTIHPDGRGMTGIATVEDPDTFNGPITMMKEWFKTDFPMLETVCPENNEDFFHQNLFPIPQAAKADF